MSVFSDKTNDKTIYTLGVNEIFNTAKKRMTLSMDKMHSISDFYKKKICVRSDLKLTKIFGISTDCLPLILGKTLVHGLESFYSRKPRQCY